MQLSGPNYLLDAERCAALAQKADVKAVVIASPGNPTSVAVPREDLERLASLLNARECLLILDESFVDFCPAGQSLEDRLPRHRNLAIVKSMGKAYGISGLRLGYLLTANDALVASVARTLAVWNVNGVAEAFLRLLPRYRDAFVASCQHVRQDRDELYRRLGAMEGLDVTKPDGNFVFVTLRGSSLTAHEVACGLLSDHDILVKECSGKSMPDAERSLRIGSRTRRENARLASALAEIIHSRTLDQRPAEHGAASE
jgi:histidinol-phosphate/aromatic aminotransferase/cobyric acid decarboxylase-like protein